MSASDALKTAIASAEAKELHGTRGAYRFERFSFGERGSTLDKDLIVRVGVGLAHQISRLSHPFDYIVAPEPGGHTWGLLTAFLLGTSLRIVRLATEYFEAAVPVTATSAYTIKTFDFSNFQSGDRVVLIDDVISSGGTLRAICAALFSANVQIAGVHCVYAKGPTTALADELGLPIFALSGEESVQEDSLWPTRPASKAFW